MEKTVTNISSNNLADHAGTADIADSYYMHEALKQARNAALYDEVPIGAIVVAPDGAIIGRGYNQVESQKTQRAHAEGIALEQAAHALNNWRLEGCTLYVTLEPCVMCMGLIRLSRLKRVVYATNSPLFGYRLDKDGSSWVYKNDIEMVDGVAAVEAQQLLKKFFQEKRKKKGECNKTGFGGNKKGADTATE